ncbi:uncharacterized protein LOC131165844 [Malania oleifera]|uniref:uncharacterized protein LOC131165844 n=1 Tax=Malania oleifera TaxID=397392 RepID=UPI0025AEA2A1|nr:uncharacterized protein LOC131165844 [Malania oleifera]
MSQIRETSQDPFKACKILVFSSEKPAGIPALLIRAAVLILLVTTLSLVFFAFSGQTRLFSCPQCGRSPVDSELSCETLAGDFAPTNISHILFGIGGSVNTWPDRRRYSELWWRPDTTRGFVWLDGDPGPNLSRSDNTPPYRVSEDWSGFKYSSSRSSVRIARIVLESFRLGLPDVRWFVMGDDDTVFFTENLVSVLAKYDHREMYYVGGSSESVEQDVMHSYGMAFGGGGFAISYPLAARLAMVLDGCIDRYYKFYGSDQRVWACMSEIGVPLTRERGFHQIDIRGDPYGFLAAHPVAPLVSLHHLDYVWPLFPNQTQLESVSRLVHAYRVDPPRIVQQSFCYDRRHNWTVSVSWGYTAQIYPSLVTAIDLERPLQTFQTWRSWDSGPFLFNTRPVKADPCEQPVVYLLERVVEAGKKGGKSLSSYKRVGVGKECGRAEHAHALAVNRVVVSAEKMDPEFWKKAPRRQCCEMMERGMKSSALRVRIRGCKSWETITAP